MVEAHQLLVEQMLIQMVGVGVEQVGTAIQVGSRRLWRSHHQNPRHQDRNIYWWCDR
jgi:hypothetical protein